MVQAAEYDGIARGVREAIHCVYENEQGDKSAVGRMHGLPMVRLIDPHDILGPRALIKRMDEHLEGVWDLKQMDHSNVDQLEKLDREVVQLEKCYTDKIEKKDASRGRIGRAWNAFVHFLGFRSKDELCRDALHHMHENLDAQLGKLRGQAEPSQPPGLVLEEEASGGTLAPPDRGSPETPLGTALPTEQAVPLASLSAESSGSVVLPILGTPPPPPPPGGLPSMKPLTREEKIAKDTKIAKDARAQHEALQQYLEENQARMDLLTQMREESVEIRERHEQMDQELRAIASHIEILEQASDEPVRFGGSGELGEMDFTPEQARAQAEVLRKVEPEARRQFEEVRAEREEHTAKQQELLQTVISHPPGVQADGEFRVADLQQQWDTLQRQLKALGDKERMALRRLANLEKGSEEEAMAVEASVTGMPPPPTSEKGRPGPQETNTTGVNRRALNKAVGEADPAEQLELLRNARWFRMEFIPE